MAAGMGDERKPLSAGDRWQPTASDINAIHKAVTQVENMNRGGGACGSPRITVPVPRFVVSVYNKSATDWDIWQPVGVLVATGGRRRKSRIVFWKALFRRLRSR